MRKIEHFDKILGPVFIDKVIASSGAKFVVSAGNNFIPQGLPGDHPYVEPPTSCCPRQPHIVAAGPVNDPASETRFASTWSDVYTASVPARPRGPPGLRTAPARSC